ncbi:hypothetical protein [Neobacillus mesonae]|uniref:Uncharacterized protein n=1 Tax=Neobacillus mesonae TaxID=1193713 RepID=A0A3T0HZJ5_9BACI|nr:hypothetical protein [Neobacillus mesonae]AZU62556.1 hypothetical protein CHR53_15465 [Neobacillus mesonae]
MPNQSEAIIEAFKSLGGEREILEVRTWVDNRYGPKWKDFSTMMADMVPIELGGNHSSTIPEWSRVLERVARGKYKLIDSIEQDT